MFGTVSDSIKYVQLFADSSTKLGLENSVEEQIANSTPSLQNDTVISLSENASSNLNDSGNEPKCFASANIGSTENQWYVEYPKEHTNNRVRLYIMDKNGAKWYLRAHFHGRRIDLVCEDYVNSIGNVRSI